MATYKFVPTPKYTFVPNEPAQVTDEAPLEEQTRQSTVVGSGMVDMTPPIVFNQERPETEFVDLEDFGAGLGAGEPVTEEPVTEEAAPVVTEEPVREDVQFITPPEPKPEPEPEPKPVAEKVVAEESGISEEYDPFGTSLYTLKGLESKELGEVLLSALRYEARALYKEGKGAEPDPEDGLTMALRRVYNNFDSFPIETRKAIFEALSKQKEANELRALSRMSSMEVYEEPEKAETRSIIPGQLDVLGFDPSAEAMDITAAKVDPADAFVSGLGMTKEMFKNIPTSMQAQFGAQAIQDKRKLLDIYTRLDAGEKLPAILQEFTPSKLFEEETQRLAKEKQVPYGGGKLLTDEAAVLTGSITGLSPQQKYLYDYGRAYADGSNVERAYAKDALRKDIEQSIVAYTELLPKLNKFIELSQEYKKGIPNLADAKSVDDVVNALSFYSANGLATILPIAFSGAVGGPPAALAVAAPLNLAGNINNRYNHLLKLFAGLKTDEEKADAMIKYMDVTKDDTLRTGIISTMLDTFLGPVGRIIKNRYIKDLAARTGKSKAKETVVDAVTEGGAEAAQRLNEIASSIRLREEEGPVYSKENLKLIGEDFVAGMVGSTAFRSLELVTAPALREAYNRYETMKGNHTVNKLLESGDLHPEEQAYIEAQIEAGVSPIEALALSQITWGQTTEPVLPERPDPEEFVAQTNIDNPNTVSFLYRDNELQDDVKRGKYTQEDADTISSRAWTLINEEDVPPVKAFGQAKKELAEEQAAKKEEAKQTAKEVVAEEKVEPEAAKETQQVVEQEAQETVAEETTPEEVTPSPVGEEIDVEAITDPSLPPVAEVEEPVLDPVTMPAVVRRRQSAPVNRDEIDLSSFNTKDDKSFDEAVADKPVEVDANKAADELAGQWEVLNDDLGVLNTDEKRNIFRRAAEIVVDNPGTQAEQVAKKILQNATPFESNQAFNQAKSRPKVKPAEAKKPSVVDVFSGYQEGDTTGSKFSRLLDLFTSPDPNTVINDVLRASEQLFSPQVREGIQAEWRKAYDDAMQTAPANQKKLLARIPAALAGDQDAQQAVRKGYQDKVLSKEQYQLANPSQWWASNARDILSQPTEEGSWQRTAAVEQRDLIDDLQRLMQLDATDPVVQAINEATNNRVTEQAAPNAEQVENERIDAELEDAPTDGTAEELSEEIVPFTDTQKAQLNDAIDATPPVDTVNPDEVLDAETLDRMTRGYSIPTRDRVENLKVVFKYFNILSPEKQVKLLALLQTSDVHRLFKKFTKGILGPDDTDHIANVIEEVRVMNAETGRWIKQYRPLVLAWSKVNSTKAGPLLAELMNLSTKYGIDVNSQTLEQLLDPTATDPNTGELLGDAELIRYRDALGLKGKDELSTAAAAAVSKKINIRRSEIRVLYDKKREIEQLPNGKDALEVYDRVKAAYKDFFDTYERVLKQNVKNLALDPEQEERMLAGITDRFNAARTNIPVYFKLSRRGDNFIRIKEGEYKGFYQLNDSEYRAAKSFITKPKTIDPDTGELRGLGIDWGDASQVSYGNMKSKNYRAEFDRELVGSDGMLRDMFKAIDEATSGASKMDAVDFAKYQQALKEQLGQMYLQTLPGNNVKTMFFARNKNARGESLDNLASFGETLTSVASQFPRIIHAPRIKREISALDAQTRNLPNQKDVLDPIIDEMRARVGLELSPSQSGWARFAGAANKLTFLWLLSSPKSALIQTTQFPIVVMPLLAEKYGTARATAMVAKYMAAYNKLGAGHTTAQLLKREFAPLSILNSSYMKGHKNKEAMQYAWSLADDYNMFDVTYASDLGNISNLPDNMFSDSALRYFSKGGAGIYKLMTGFFQMSERMTRELTYMSSFEMAYDKAKKEGLNEQDARNRAVNEAMAMTQEGLFDYTRFNKARVMYETAPGQLITQFMSYSTMMSSLLIRHAHTVIISGETLEERRQAAVAFAGILGQTAILAGINGVWGLGVVVPLLTGLWKALSASVQWALGDDDNEELVRRAKEVMADGIEDEKQLELTKEILRRLDEAKKKGDPYLDYSLQDFMDYEYIPNTFGPGGSLSNYFTASDQTWLTAQLAAQRGVPAAYGWDLSGSLSLNNMFLQDDIIDTDIAPAALFLDYASQLRIAPVLGMVAQIYTGVQQALQGDIFKGIETASPGIIKGGVKAARRRKDGKLNYKGDPVIPASYYTWGKSIQLGLGFADTREQLLSRDSFRTAQINKLIEKERQQLINNYDKVLKEVVKDKAENATEESVVRDERMVEAHLKIAEWNAIYPKYGFTDISVRTTLPEKIRREALNRYVTRLTDGLFTDYETYTTNHKRRITRLRRARKFLGSFYPFGYITDEEIRQKLEALDAKLAAEEAENVENRKSKIGEKLKDSSYEIDWSK